MFKKLVGRIIGDPNKKIIDELEFVVGEVAALEPRFQALTDDQIREETLQLRERAQSGEDLEELLPEAAALIREASTRTTGLRHYDVQIMGGTLLHRGNVIEMRTGEGKTLAGTLPLFLNALAGDGVHLVTVNDYLVRRDGGWMGKIFSFMGMSVGCIGSEQFSGIYDPEYVNPGTELEDERLVHWRPCTRKEAYSADITYGTSSEFGFDYLRDNMVSDRERLVQRGQITAIIDEVDNVLIDESRTPLIISGPASQSGKEYSRFSDYVRRLKENTQDEGEEPDGHYDIDHKAKAVSLTEMGIAEIERRIVEIDADAGDSLYDPRFFHLTYYLDNAMKAQYLFHRDQQYMVSDGQVVIVDDFTGRPMPSRRYSDGLHEAIEAKESVEIKRETTTVATITLQNYFRMYQKLAGMTGTAMTDAEEFDRIYELGVFPLPTNVQYIVDSGKMGLKERTKDQDGSKGIYYTKPGSEEAVFFKRTDHPDQVFGAEGGKDIAIVDEIERIHGQGRPVLVGTTSVEHSEFISKTLRQRKIEHNVLNAKMHRSEASVVAQAGRKGAVTISTNMAGRGTDILLGGNAEGLASSQLEDELFDRLTLEQLSKTLFTKSESAAREYATKSSKLDVQLVDALVAMDAEYSTAAAKIDSVQLPTYIAQKLHDEHGVDLGISRKMLSSIRLGALQQAREHLQDNNVDTALVEEAVRLDELHTGYGIASRDAAKKATFLAEQLFDQHYTARAALIRAVMGGDIESAQQMIATVQGLSAELITRVEQIKADTELERKEVWDVGGLHVIGSERHESRRIDNQLRGRAARQGDPGSSRFFISLEDDLMLRFGGERLNSFYSKFNIPEDLPIENKMVDKLIENSQSRLEGYNFDVRKNLVEYDDVMSKQRESIYRERREILLSDDLNLDEKIGIAFDGVTAQLSADYLDNYPQYARSEIDRVVGEYSTDATNEVNGRAVLVRLRGLLPDLMTMDRSELESLSGPDLADKLEDMAHDNVDRGVNIYQLLQAMRSFVPLLPSVPNVGALLSPRRDRLPAREGIRRDFMKRVEELYDDFLAEHMDSAERQTIWQKAQSEINEAFVRFNVEGASVESLQGQQEKFKTRVDAALSELLMDGLRSVDSAQLSDALDAYVIKQSNNWRKRIGEEEYRNFQRTVLLGAIDREWRDYLTAMDDLRREIGLEAFAQRDPKVMYKKRSFEMFTDMRANINEFVAKNYFLQIERSQQFVKQQEQVAQANVQSSVKRNAVASGYQRVQRSSGKGTEVKREMPKLGRNAPCWCGSGKKYKACHLKTDRSGETTAPSTV